MSITYLQRIIKDLNKIKIYLIAGPLTAIYRKFNFILSDDFFCIAGADKTSFIVDDEKVPKNKLIPNVDATAIQTAPLEIGS